MVDVTVWCPFFFFLFFFYPSGFGSQTCAIHGVLTTPLNFFFFFLNVISFHGCNYHTYADNTELSESDTSSDFLSSQFNFQTCISDILSWKQSNKLKLNVKCKPVANHLHAFSRRCVPLSLFKPRLHFKHNKHHFAYFISFQASYRQKRKK